MARALDFNALWNRYKDARKLGDDINPDGNRCALVLSAALGLKYKPRKEAGDISFRDISQPPDGIRGQPFLDKFYVKAEQFAARIREEWGQEDYIAVGSGASSVLAGKRGVVFVENAWYAGFPPAKTVDHVDLWNGQKMGAYSEEKSQEIFKKSDVVHLWVIV